MLRPNTCSAWLVARSGPASAEVTAAWRSRDSITAAHAAPVGQVSEKQSLAASPRLARQAQRAAPNRARVSSLPSSHRRGCRGPRHSSWSGFRAAGPPRGHLGTVERVSPCPGGGRRSSGGCPCQGRSYALPRVPLHQRAGHRLLHDPTRKGAASLPCRVGRDEQKPRFLC